MSAPDRQLKGPRLVWFLLRRTRGMPLAQKLAVFQAVKDELASRR